VLVQMPQMVAERKLSASLTTPLRHFSLFGESSDRAGCAPSVVRDYGMFDRREGAAILSGGQARAPRRRGMTAILRSPPKQGLRNDCYRSARIDSGGRQSIAGDGFVISSSAARR
jgi:hypothetical protein